MDELADRDQAGLAAVEDALQTYPLQPYPATILPAVMKRIEDRKPAVQFRLDWVDYAISLLAAGLATLVLIFWASFQERPYWLAWLKSEFLSVWLPIRVGPPIYGVALLASIALCLLALATAGLLFTHEHSLRQE